jgi:hypothetical protein
MCHLLNCETFPHILGVPPKCSRFQKHRKIIVTFRGTVNQTQVYRSKLLHKAAIGAVQTAAKKVAERHSSHFANASLRCFSGGRRLMRCACVHSQLSRFHRNRTKQWKGVMMSSSQDIHASDPAEIIDIVVLIALSFNSQWL